MGDTWYYSPSVWGGGQSILHPQYVDHGVALTCEYLSEGFEFSYTSTQKSFCSLRSHFHTFVGKVIRDRRVRFYGGTFPSLLVGLWQVPVLHQLKKRRKIYSKPSLPESRDIGVGDGGQGAPLSPKKKQIWGKNIFRARSPQFHVRSTRPYFLHEKSNTPCPKKSPYHDF